MPLDTAIHGDSEPFTIIQQQEQPIATTSTQDQPSEFSQDFYAQRARRVQPQRQRHGRFGTHSLDEFIQKHIEREGETKAYHFSPITWFDTYNTRIRVTKTCSIKLLNLHKFYNSPL